MRKRRRRLKKKVKYFLITLLLILIIITILITLKLVTTKSPSTKEPKITYQDTITDILTYNFENTQIDNDFLTWIYQKYGESTLNQLKETLINDNYTNFTWHNLTANSLNVLLDLYNNNYENKTNVKIIDTTKDEISLSFVGDVSLADNWYIMPKYDSRKKGIYGILSKEVVDIMTSTDIMVANSEFTISNRGKKMPGKMYTFRASPERLSIYEEMGVDLVTLANNHVYDFGEEAFTDMLDSLGDYNIPYIGAGRNLAEASTPYYFVINGYKIAFVNATRAEKNIMTPEATENEGGVLRCYDPTYFSNLISETKTHSDYVIALVHWGREDSHSLEDVQPETGKLYIDSGADAIIGTHAHVLQGVEFYKDKLIAYNLGDFIFNNETKDTGILTIKIDNNGQMKYYFDPCKESNEYTRLLADKEKTNVLNKMTSWSINATFKEDGEIIKN